MAENAEWNARIDLAAAHRLAVLDGLNEGSWNHFSLMIPGHADRMLVSPEFTHWRQVRASILDLVDSAGRSAWGTDRFDPSAYCIHWPIHSRCPQARCVLHAHPTYAMAVTLPEGAELRMAEQGAVGFLDRVAYYPYDGNVFTLEHGARLADALGDKSVLFLRGHGVIVVGPTVAEAYTDLYQLERACAVQCHAAALAGTIRDLPEAIARSVTEGDYPGRYKELHFAAMRRLLDAEQPDYAT